MKRMLSLLLMFGSFCAGSSVVYAFALRAATITQQQVSIPTETQTAQKSTQEKKSAIIIFSGNFQNNIPCHDHETSGCDLFKGEIDLDTGDVISVEALTTTPNESETFPVIAQENNKIYAYNLEKEGKNSAILRNEIEEKPTTIASTGMHPTLSSQGTTAYVSEEKTFALQEINTETLEKYTFPSTLRVFEPHVNTQGLIAYYALTQGAERGSSTAQAMIFSPEKNTTITVSSADGTAHCFWSFKGETLYCNNRAKGGILAYSISENGEVKTPTVALSFPEPSELGKIDTAFQDPSCVTTSLEYGSFCNEDTLSLTASCYIKSEGALTQKFTHAVLYNIKTKTFIDIGAALANAFNGAGSESWTTACATKD